MAPVRIGTWNLAGRWDSRHYDFLARLDCDVWLLTEVSERLELPGYDRHLTTGLMAARRRWAGIVSRLGLEPLADPHPASAMASAAGLTFCSSILPWKAAPSRDPWVGGGHAEKMGSAVTSLLPQLPRTDLIWGGDWKPRAVRTRVRREPGWSPPPHGRTRDSRPTRADGFSRSSDRRAPGDRPHRDWADHERRSRSTSRRSDGRATAIRSRRVRHRADLLRLRNVSGRGPRTGQIRTPWSA